MIARHFLREPSLNSKSAHRAPEVSNMQSRSLTSSRSALHAWSGAANPAIVRRGVALAGILAVALSTTAVDPAMASQASAAPTPAATMANKLPVVSIVPARTREITETAIVSGTLVAREDIMVATEIEGLAITEILVEEGDRVAKGQVLARLQRATLDTQLAQNAALKARAEATVAQAQAQIAEVQANLTEAGGALDRSRQLKESGYTSAANYDKNVAAKQSWEAKRTAAQSAMTAAQYDIASLDAQRREIEVRIARAEIKAPKAGLVSRRSAKLGAVASGVGEPLFRIIADGEIELEAEIADVNLPRISAGQAVIVTPAGFSEALTGAVRLVSPEVDKTTRLGRIRVALPANKNLPVGAFARGVVELGKKTGVSVPQSAITFGKVGASVQVLQQGQVRTRLVRLGLVGEGFIEVASGLQDGEQVVARAGSFLRDGDRVVGVLEAAKNGTAKDGASQ
jgi:HlyD family secretion protein